MIYFLIIQLIDMGYNVTLPAFDLYTPSLKFKRNNDLPIRLA